MYRNRASVWSALVVFFIASVAGRGRLVDPPNRSSLWREGYMQPVNRNDSDLNCGADRLPYLPFELDGGWCGICGDAIFEQRKHELGGLYVPEYTVSRRYTTRSKHIDVEVLVEDFVGGFFEFTLCVHNYDSEKVSQECLNEHRLRIAGYGTHYFPLRTGLHWLKLVIPTDVQCEHCVLQWRWITEKFTYDKCDRPPVPRTCLCPWHYQNCADISITGEQKKSDDSLEYLEDLMSDLDGDQLWMFPFFNNSPFFSFMASLFDF